MLKPIDDMKRVLALFTRCNPRCRVLSIWSILFALILASVTLFYRAEKEKAFLHLKNDVKDISEIKIKQFVDWHNDRLADLRMFSESPFLSDAISSWIDTQLDDGQAGKGLVRAYSDTSAKTAVTQYSEDESTLYTLCRKF